MTEAVIAGQPAAFLLDAKTRAQLSRCDDPTFVSGAHDWARKMKALPRFQGASYEKLLDAAKVVAEVRHSTDLRLGKNLGKAKVTERHLQRLLAASQDEGELAQQLTKIIRILKRTANVIDLTALLLYWNDRDRRNLAMDYYSIPFQEDAQ